MAEDSRLSILHVVVVGFHHKKGYQVEYCYPPFSSDPTVEANTLPEEWKNLPSLALPDGSHNFTEDTAYFHLPSRVDQYKTVYCVSCYRQIDAKALVSKGADVTRNSVQKSVCVLSNLPLYGLIKAKLELVTHAYFDELDFSQVSLLKETYENLSAMLTDNLVSSSQVFIGLSCRKLVRKYYHQVLILFKLILLEKKVLFYGTPVYPICDGILSLLSLFPGMVERGLEECLDTSRSSSEDMASSTLTVRSAGSGLDEYLEVHFHSARVEEGQEVLEASAEVVAAPPSPTSKDHPSLPQSSAATATTSGKEKGNGDNRTRHASNSEERPLDDAAAGSGKMKQPQRQQRGGDDEDLIDSDEESGWLAEDRLHLAIESNTTSPIRASNKRGRDRDDTGGEAPGSPGLRTIKDMVTSLVWPGSKAEDVAGAEEGLCNTPSPTHVATDGTGLPLSIFTKGVICQPYLSLQYVDLLTNANVRGFVVGVTNSLFLSRKNLVDVIVEVSEGKIQIADGDLKKLVTLTTADLRFIDDIVQHVSEESGDIFLEDTEWEGGDEWIRAQFRSYMLSLLATVQSNDAKSIEDFGTTFVAAWRLSNNFRLWQSQGPFDFRDVRSGHVCQGQLGVSDLKLRVAHTLQSSEKGRKLNTAVTQTGKMAAQTGKVVGDAITNAKSVVTKTVTSWFGGFGGVFGKSGAVQQSSPPAHDEDDVEVLASECAADTNDSDKLAEETHVAPSESVQSIESLLDLK